MLLYMTLMYNIPGSSYTLQCKVDTDFSGEIGLYAITSGSLRIDQISRSPCKEFH